MPTPKHLAQSTPHKTTDSAPNALAQSRSTVTQSESTAAQSKSAVTHSEPAAYDTKSPLAQSKSTATYSESLPQLSASAVVLIALYVASQMLADVGSLKIAYIFAFSIDCGTFIYPLTFTLRDMVHQKLGKRVAKTLVIASGAINLGMVAFFALVTALPQDPSWANQDAWQAIFQTVWRIALASIVAEVIGELLDTEIYHLWVTRFPSRRRWSRALVSNAVSIPVDTVIFSLIAFGGTLGTAALLSLIAANIAVKFAVSLAAMPALYLVRDDDSRTM